MTTLNNFSCFIRLSLCVQCTAQSKHLKGQLGPRVGDVTFFNHGGQLGPCVGDVTFFNHGGQLGTCVGDVTFFNQKEVSWGPASVTWHFSRWFQGCSRFLVGFHGFSRWFLGFSWFLLVSMVFHGGFMVSHKIWKVCVCHNEKNPKNYQSITINYKKNPGNSSQQVTRSFYIKDSHFPY